MFARSRVHVSVSECVGGGGGGGVIIHDSRPNLIRDACVCTTMLSPPVIKTFLLFKVPAVVIVCFCEPGKRHPAV